MLTPPMSALPMPLRYTPHYVVTLFFLNESVKRYECHAYEVIPHNLLTLTVYKEIEEGMRIVLKREEWSVGILLVHVLMYTVEVIRKEKT